MRLIKSTILQACEAAKNPLMQKQSQIDYEACEVVTVDAQTIIFSTEQMMELRPALDDYDSAVDYHLPFAFMILQFSSPIPELDFMHGAMSADSTVEQTLPASQDAIMALVLSQTDDGQIVNNAIAYYQSSSINRVLWYGTGDEAVNIAPKDQPTVGQIHIDDKRAIRRMAIAAMAYINCANIELHRYEPNERVNRKRRKRGKRELEPYYTCEIVEPTGRRSEATGDGSSHSFRYDVRGHFRRLPDGRTIWVQPHQRGLRHRHYVPKTYRSGDENE